MGDEEYSFIKSVSTFRRIIAKVSEHYPEIFQNRLIRISRLFLVSLHLVT